MAASASSHNPGLAPFLSWSAFQMAFVVLTGVLIGYAMIGPALSIYFYIGVVLAAAAIIAQRHPGIFVTLLFLATIVADNLWASVEQLSPMIDIGPFNIHPADPFVFGLAVGIVFRLASLDPAMRELLVRRHFFLSLLLRWLGLAIVRGIGGYGINAVGEARTYYAPLLLVPFLAASLRTPSLRSRAFLTTVVLCFGAIIVAALRALLSPEITLGVRILSASGTLAILFGVVATVTLLKRGLLGTPKWLLYGGYVVCGFLLLFTSHRSVWAAACVAALVMVIMRQVQLRLGLSLAVIGLAAGFLTLVALAWVGHEPLAFMTDRAQAFVFPRADPTTSWRLHLWEAALKDVREHPILGMGFGRHFELQGPGWMTVYTSPHNLFMTVLFELGFPGLILYVAFVGTLLFQLYRALRSNAFKGIDGAIVATGFTALLAAHAFYTGYAIDWVTWIYAGLAASVLIQGKRDQQGQDVPHIVD